MPSVKMMFLIRDCLILRTVSQRIQMLLFTRAFKAGTLSWLFLSILILGKEVRTFPTGGLQLKTTAITVRTIY